MVAKSVFYPVVLLGATLLLYAYIYSPDYSIQKTFDSQTQALKHILLWTDPTLAPLNFLGHGFKAFIANGCEYTNCYVTYTSSSRSSMVDYDYDAIVFNGRHLPVHLPQDRSEKQKYVYANMESSHNYPVCDDRFEGFFNWTWTYKLDSDSKWGYFTIYDLTGNEIGPRIDMHWRVMDPVENKTKALLASKRLAAAWFVSNCKSKSKREPFAEATAKQLYRYGLSLDVYGKCGKFVCSRRKESECNERLEKNYYFYFAFENSFSEDYVTEKVLTALQHLTVPVVFGGANYSRGILVDIILSTKITQGIVQDIASNKITWVISVDIFVQYDHLGLGDQVRFLPPGSYLDARELGPRRLAERIAGIIHDHKNGGNLYHDFFRWRNHYIYKETSEKEDVCKICKLLNDPVSVSKVTTYDRFRRWWNSDGSSCPDGHVQGKK